MIPPVAVLFIDTVTVTVTVTVPVPVPETVTRRRRRSQAGTAGIVVMFNGIVILVARNVFDFYTLSLAQTIVDGQTNG